MEQVVQYSAVTTYYKDIPCALINEELGVQAEDFKSDLTKIKQFYDVYKKGKGFVTEGSSGDYVPSMVRFKKAADLIDKESRFMFAETPDFMLKALVDINKNQEDKKEIEKMQNLLAGVFNNNSFGKQLLQSSKDCFIGKRIACVVDVNDEGIKTTFYSSLEFLYETEVDDTDKIIKFVGYKRMNRSDAQAKDDLLVKKFTLETVQGRPKCFVEEYVADSNGTYKKEVLAKLETKYDYLPVAVILNDGLIGDTKGNSEVEELEDYEAIFSKMSNADIDAENKSMNPIRYTVDMSFESTKGLRSSAGSYWDLKHDQSVDKPAPQVGTLAPAMNHSEPLKMTLDRVNTIMHQRVDVPDISVESMQGTLTSGKALKAIYWSLIVRCKEKMKSWEPALQKIVKTIIDSAVLYSDLINGLYIDEAPKIIKYEIDIELNFPLPEDEEEEKTMYLAEVTANVRSRKSYLKKWAGLTDTEADDEILQIIKEMNMLENMDGLTGEQSRGEVILDQVV